MHAATQRSFAELGTPLGEVTFCVVDLETTGGSPTDAQITEIGAVKVRRGEVEGTFQTLVNPGEPVPAFIRLLTGISDEMLIEAPPIGPVLPSFLEFAHGCVLVAHNARFDIGFLNASLRRAGYEALEHRVIDTAVLARKVLAGDVRDHRLATLARQLRCAHQPCHRAFADVLATIDVLHHLIERASGYGVTTLEDLLALSATRLDGTFTKIKLTAGVPSGTGIYRFLDAGGRTLYVGVATDLRTRVRSYFYGDPRRRMRSLLRETQGVRAEVYPTTLEAEVAEARAIAGERPPYNRVGKGRATWYLKVAYSGSSPRVHATRTPRDDRALYLGPLKSLRAARDLQDALRDAARLHRCAEPRRCNGCAFGEMGSCAGGGRRANGALRDVALALAADPGELLDGLRARLRRLAAQHRFEEAAEARTRAAGLERMLVRAAEIRGLLDAGEVALAVGKRAVLLRDGQLAAALDRDGDDTATVARLKASATSCPVGSYLTDEAASTARVLVSWLRRHAAEVVLLHVSGSWALPRGLQPGRFEVLGERSR